MENCSEQGKPDQRKKENGYSGMPWPSMCRGSVRGRGGPWRALGIVVGALPLRGLEGSTDDYAIATVGGLPVAIGGASTSRRRGAERRIEVCPVITRHKTVIGRLGFLVSVDGGTVGLVGRRERSAVHG